MLINQILKNPIVKICAVIVILYFGLFSNEENPNSLRNKLSKERIEKNLHDATNKSKFIVTNVGAARKFAQEQEEKGKEIENLIIECGDEVKVDYNILNKGNNLYSEKSKKFVIGSKIDFLIEKNLIGMKKGESKKINIMEGVDQKTNINDISYYVTIVAIEKKIATSKANLACD